VAGGSRQSSPLFIVAHGAVCNETVGAHVSLQAQKRAKCTGTAIHACNMPRRPPIALLALCSLDIGSSVVDLEEWLRACSFSQELTNCSCGGIGCRYNCSVLTKQARGRAG
jgi:hypothetical protein